MTSITKHLQLARIASCLIFLVSGIGVSCWAPMVPIVKARLDLNEAELGLILFVFGMGALITMPLTGWLVGRYGSKKVAFIGAPLMICTIPFLALAPSGFYLSLCLFFLGVFSGSLNVSMNSQAVAVAAKYPKPIMSGFHCFFSFGGLLGAGLVSVLLEYEFSLATCGFLVFALLTIILATQCRNLLPIADDIRSVNQAAFVFPKGKILIFGLICFIFFLAEGAMLDWSAVLLRSTYGYELSKAGLGYALFSIAMTIGRFLGDRLIHRFGPVTMVKVGSFLCAIGFIFIVNVIWSPLALLGFLLIGFGASNVVPTVFSAAGKVSESSASAGLTVVTTLGYAGLLSGPALIGFVAQATTLSFALSFVAVLVIIVGINSRVLAVDSDQRLGMKI